jgi:CheY-like chemotaxis protein/HPt (histidine-containing phosphotransfer) domain-containing protein
LVEDDVRVGEALQESLTQDDLVVTCVRNAEQALVAIAQQPFHLILLDLGLPGMDGFELLPRLRPARQPELLPIIILTAKNNTADKLRGFELGASDYVTKPFDSAELRARVRAALRRQQLQAQLLGANREMEAARAAAEESAKSKAEFLANMSHEIRTPMNGVIAMTGLLMQTDLGTDQRDFVETIRTSGESLITIINDILNFSKLESGKLELEHRPFHLRDCLEETLDLLAAKAAEKNLDLAYRIAPGTPEQAVGDVTRLRQILVNLISNAIKFTPAGEIFVSLSAQPAAAAPADPSSPTPHDFHITVRDTGIGIPSDRLSRLFQSYAQADSSITRQFGGTGLGLAISKGLVGLMGGKMWVESEEGKGSSFHFTLRLPASAGAPTPLHQPHPALSALRVLVAEDNATVRGLLSEQLRVWGMTPIEAPSAQHALSHVHAGAVLDLAVIDGSLGGMDAGALAQEIRRHPRFQTLPVVFLSTSQQKAGTAAGDPQRTTQVNKPLRPAQLQNALVQVRSGARQEVKRTQPASRLDGAMASRVPLRILLADDNIINQKVALRLLQQLGYKAATASNGLEALRAVERETYDVVLMDVQMPEMDGLEATRRIRQREKATPRPHPIVIIAMTANAMQGDREKCLAAGMTDYLPKPVRPEALQALLQEHGARLSKSAAPDGSGEKAAALAGPESVPATAPVLTVLPALPSPGGPRVEPPPVDLERLNDFAGGNAENFNELVTLYVKQTTEQLEQIRTALLEPDSDRASRLAHSCAGASATCGMTAIVPLLRQVEILARDGELGAAAQVMPSVQAEFQRLQQYLQTHKPIALAS